MLQKRKSLMVAGLVGLFSLAPAFVAVAQQVDLTPEVNALLSRLQSMGHGYFSDAEWKDVYQQVEAMSVKAEQAGAWESLVDIRLIKSMMLSDMRRDYKGALAVLEDTRQRYDNLKLKNMGRVFVREAEVYSKLGDEEAIVRLIAEFKKSPYYDPQNYAYSGGWGREVPLSITRPGARGNDSVSVSTMEMFRNRAKYAPGKSFPDFEFVDSQGNTRRLSEYQGNVVLLDFWATGWEPWKQALPQLLSTYSRYRKDGFEVLGINLERDRAGAEAFVDSQKLPWPQALGQPQIATKFGIFGEATSFLIGQNGQIIDRNLSGADLVQAVKTALGK
jgi:peroxiredoxin